MPFIARYHGVVFLLVAAGAACTDAKQSPASGGSSPAAAADTVGLIVERPAGEATATVTINGRQLAPAMSDSLHFAPAARVVYVIAPSDSTHDVSVLLDDQPAPPTGEVVMDRAHRLFVITFRKPLASGVTKENQALYDIAVTMFRSEAPAKYMQDMMDEIGCLVEWYGDARGEALIRAADSSARATVGQDVARRSDQRLAGAGGEARNCSKKRP